MPIRTTLLLPADDLDTAWKLYEAAFRDLDTLAVQRHLMHRSEFDAVATDHRIRKYLCEDDAGLLAGLATFTNDLDAVPLISPSYFERRWPDWYTQQQIWYVGFLAVAPSRWSTGVYTGLVHAMFRDLQAEGGHLAVLDVCTERARLPESVTATLARIDAGASSCQLDAQSYHGYLFP